METKIASTSGATADISLLGAELPFSTGNYKIPTFLTTCRMANGRAASSHDI
jgi:hypothetical protein